MRKSLFYLSLLLSYSSGVWGQAQQVKTSAPSGINPERESGVAANRLFLIDYFGKVSVTDGTDAGTFTLVQGMAAKDLAPAGNLMVFTADDGTHGRELWVSDGSVSGTHMLVDINPSGSGIFKDTSCASRPGNLISDGSLVYFRANDGVHGYELWRTNGTVAGTYMVKDINPYGDGITASSCNIDKWGTVLSGLFYFAASDSTHGTELWTSDGSAAGTSMVADQVQGSYSSSPVNFHTAGTHMFFKMQNPASVPCIYVSNGTAAGTHLIAAGLAPTSYATGGSTTFFTVAYPNKLYKIDTANQVSLLTDTMNVPPWLVSWLPSNRIAAYDNSAYYLSENNTQYQLMRIDASGTTSILKTSGQYIGLPIVAGNKLWFKGMAADSTFDLYYSNGTATGTQKIIYPVTSRYKFSGLLPTYVFLALPSAMGNDIYYTIAYDSTAKLELYKTSIFTTGIAAQSPAAGAIKLYPNPAQSALTITGDHISGLRIYSTTGTLLQKQKTDSRLSVHTLRIDQLPPGLYLLTADMEGAPTTSIRFEKQ